MFSSSNFFWEVLQETAEVAALVGWGDSRFDTEAVSVTSPPQFHEINTTEDNITSPAQIIPDILYNSSGDTTHSCNTLIR